MEKVKFGRLFGAALAMCVAAGSWICTANADYAPERAFFSLEFDGKDDTSNWMTTNGGTFKASDFITEDGYFVTRPNGTGGFGYCGLKLDYESNHISVQTNDKMVWETRLKINLPDAQLDGEYLNITDSQFMVVNGPHSNTRAVIKLKNGYLGYGGDHNTVSYASDYRLKNDTWYTIRADIHVVSKNMEVYITDDNGNKFQGEAQGLSYNADWATWSEPKGYRYITSVTFMRNLHTNMLLTMDYSRLWDESFSVTKTSIADGAEDVSADAEFCAEFYGNLKSGAEDYVAVSDSDGNKVPIEVSAKDDKIEIFFPAGLKYEEKYTVTFKREIENENAEKLGTDATFEFTTEEAPFKIGELKVAKSSDSVTVTSTVKNNSSSDRTFYVLTAVYDDDGNLVKMTNSKVEAKKNKTDKFTVPTDVTGLSVKTVKAYVWNGFNLE